jgi:hypothetical protein
LERRRASFGGAGGPSPFSVPFFFEEKRTKRSFLDSFAFEYEVGEKAGRKTKLFGQFHFLEKRVRLWSPKEIPSQPEVKRK